MGKLLKIIIIALLISFFISKALSTSIYGECDFCGEAGKLKQYSYSVAGISKKAYLCGKCHELLTKFDSIFK